MPKRILVLLAVLMLAVVGANADTLHGYCVPPASPCIDNGTITPTTNNPPFFAFSYSGNINRANGDFLLIGLVHDNQNSGFSLTLNGVNTTVASVAGSLVSTTEWMAPPTHFLSAYVTTPTFPHNSHPMDAYLPSTQGEDPGANGYFVYFFDFGAFNYQTAPGDPRFSVGSGAVPQGMIFLAAMYDSRGDVTVDTPNSASILAAGSPVPEPDTLLMFGSGIIGLAGVLRRKINL